MRVIDISRWIDESTAAWPGDVPFSSRWVSRLLDGAPFASACFTMGAHLGTHADAPAHVLENGASIGRVPLDAYVGPARVMDLPGRGEVGPDALPKKGLGVPRILFRTRGMASLSPLAAVALAEKGAILIGTDADSIDAGDAEDLPAHKALLERGVAILECLDLDDVAPGDYQLVALPLKFSGLDASPVRAVLIEEERWF
ncbi:MAG TPA: cyclase family protein [Thermoanaerobaculia bacterium]|nr:cyclase family protein [Thermoanaerobaculia bacterium]